VKMNPSKQVQGFFLSFSPEESEYIYETLEQHGYTKDIDGLKKWILESMEAAVESPRTATDIAIEKIERYIQEHPEKINTYVGLCGNIINKLAQRKRTG